MIDGKNHFDKPINNDDDDDDDDDFQTYENIWEIASGKRGDYTTGCLLDYPYFKENYKMVATDLSKQQALDADPRVTQQINFTANLDRTGNTTIVFTIEEAKETILDFTHEL